MVLPELWSHLYQYLLLILDTGPLAPSRTPQQFLTYPSHQILGLVLRPHAQWQMPKRKQFKGGCTYFGSQTQRFQPVWLTPYFRPMVRQAGNPEAVHLMVTEKEGPVERYNLGYVVYGFQPGLTSQQPIHR